MIQVIGTKKCQNTKKALRYFRERRVDHHFVDLNARRLSAGELKSIMQQIPAAELIDTDSKRYEQRGLAYMKIDVAEELLEDPLLLRTPIVRTKNRAFVGLTPEGWETLTG